MQPMKHPFSLKKTLTVLFLLSNFISIAQRTMFHAQNKHVAQTAAAPTAVAPLLMDH
jgi:hypothetical protein